jgi:hypothetical protein
MHLFLAAVKRQVYAQLPGVLSGARHQRRFSVMCSIKERKKYCSTFIEGSCSSKLKPQKCPMIKASRSHQSLEGKALAQPFSHRAGQNNVGAI